MLNFFTSQLIAMLVATFIMTTITISATEIKNLRCANACATYVMEFSDNEHVFFLSIMGYLYKKFW
jgi:archaellum component FlaF (FlaF/FlaG flagellin family)